MTTITTTITTTDTFEETREESFRTDFDIVIAEMKMRKKQININAWTNCPGCCEIRECCTCLCDCHEKKFRDCPNEQTGWCDGTPGIPRRLCMFSRKLNGKCCDPIGNMLINE